MSVPCVDLKFIRQYPRYHNVAEKHLLDLAENDNESRYLCMRDRPKGIPPEKFRKLIEAGNRYEVRRRTRQTFNKNNIGQYKTELASLELKEKYAVESGEAGHGSELYENPNWIESVDIRFIANFPSTHNSVDRQLLKLASYDGLPKVLSADDKPQWLTEEQFQIIIKAAKKYIYRREAGLDYKDKDPIRDYKIALSQISAPFPEKYQLGYDPDGEGKTFFNNDDKLDPWSMGQFKLKLLHAWGSASSQIKVGDDEVKDVSWNFNQWGAGIDYLFSLNDLLEEFPYLYVGIGAHSMFKGNGAMTYEGEDVAIIANTFGFGWSSTFAIQYPIIYDHLALGGSLSLGMEWGRFGSILNPQGNIHFNNTCLSSSDLKDVDILSNPNEVSDEVTGDVVNTATCEIQSAIAWYKSIPTFAVSAGAYFLKQRFSIRAFYLRRPFEMSEVVRSPGTVHAGGLVAEFRFNPWPE